VSSTPRLFRINHWRLGIVDSPLATFAKASAASRPKPRRSLGVVGSWTMMGRAGSAWWFCPTGKSRMRAMRKLPVVLICRMSLVLPKTPNQQHRSARPVPLRGAFRDRHGRWVRDAMDALAARWRTTLKRTAKTCGP